LGRFRQHLPWFKPFGTATSISAAWSAVITDRTTEKCETLPEDKLHVRLGFKPGRVFSLTLASPSSIQPGALVVGISGVRFEPARPARVIPYF
jgi:hypothetical protein